VESDHLRAELVARSVDDDLALLRLVGIELPTATIAETAARVGSLVVAVGNPFGLRGALTAGIVHGLGPITRNGAPWIHADIRLAPGNSGGPLADVSGAVVGINAMVAGGLALAVPISRVLDFVRSAGGAPRGRRRRSRACPSASWPRTRWPPRGSKRCSAGILPRGSSSPAPARSRRSPWTTRPASSFSRCRRPLPHARSRDWPALRECRR